MDIPSGKLTLCYGTSAFTIGKSTINGPFSIATHVKLPEGMSKLVSEC